MRPVATLQRGEKPSCPECGGDMEKVLGGGQKLDPVTNKWCASGSESWRCKQAMRAYAKASDEAFSKVRAEFGEHTRMIRYERVVAS